MTVEEMADKMVGDAKKHSDRFLLPRRFKIGADPEKDRLYDAAAHLVMSNRARWLSPASCYWPGIILERGRS